MMLMMTASRVADDSSDWLRARMLLSSVLSTPRMSCTVVVMLPYQTPGALAAGTPMLTLPLLLVEAASCSSNAAWSTAVPLTLFWKSCCSASEAELWKSASAADS